MYPSLQTDRLILRPWLSSDRKPFAQLNQDSEVMRYFPQLLAPTDSNRLIERIEDHFEANGFGFWAVELRQTKEFIGFTGLQIPNFQAPFMPTVEIGWRLAQKFWGQGFATEGAIAALKFGFEDLKLPEIVAFTAMANHRSIAVMKRLAMEHDPEDNFDHPALPAGHPLQHHVLYRLPRDIFSHAELRFLKFI